MKLGSFQKEVCLFWAAIVVQHGGFVKVDLLPYVDNKKLTLILGIYNELWL